MLKEASKYSNPCRVVKYKPRIIVKSSLLTASLWDPAIRAWWDQVTVTPDLNKIKVFKKGTSKALKGKIPTGGHVLASSIEGAKLLWKKAQKKERKKKTSEMIKSPIPHRSPSSTIEECNPWCAPSVEISVHHWNLIRIRDKILEINKKKDFSWNHLVSPRVRFKAAADLNKGQGDSFTRW